jgi:hypothetical protein
MLVEKYAFLLHLISNFPLPCQGVHTRRWEEYFPPPLLGGKWEKQQRQDISYLFEKKSIFVTIIFH